MSSDTMETIMFAADGIAALFVTLRAVRLIRRDSPEMLAVFYAFGCIASLISGLYWVAFTVLREGQRMPFAANELGEAASYLLYGAAIASFCPVSFRKAGKEALLSILFSAGSAALWIAWSGEWIQDTVFGLPYAYFLFMAVAAMKKNHVFSEKEWAAAGLISFGLLIGQAAVIIAQGSLHVLLDRLCYAVMYLSLFLLAVKTVRLIREKTDPSVLLSMGFGLYGWMSSCIYMSEGWHYVVMQCFELFTIILLLYAVSRRERAV